MAADRPVSDAVIDEANSGVYAGFKPWAVWNATHTASSHNQTYQDQEFLRWAWRFLRSLGRDTLASNNLAHFLGGSGTSKRVSLNKLFQEDQGVRNHFNTLAGAQINRAEREYQRMESKGGVSLEAYLKANMKRHDYEFTGNNIDFRKDYGQNPGDFDGHVEVLQPKFTNEAWKNATGGLTFLWKYVGSTLTSDFPQHRVIVWCLKRYKWHPFEHRPTQLVHIAAENAKAPSTDTSQTSMSAAMAASNMGARTGVVAPKQSGPIKLGPEVIGHWQEEGSTRQTVYNPAKEFMLIFEPVERIVPAYVPMKFRTAGV